MGHIKSNAVLERAWLVSHEGGYGVHGEAIA